MAEEAAVVAMEALEQPESGEKEHRRELHLFNQIATIIALAWTSRRSSTKSSKPSSSFSGLTPAFCCCGTRCANA